MQRPTIDSLITRKKLRRKVEGIAAALLPFEASGKIAVEAFQRHLIRTQRAGLLNAVNMDTGYVNLLTPSEKAHVLRWTREALGPNVPFVAGAFIEDQNGDPVSLYRLQIDAILRAGGTPILFPTLQLKRRSPAEKVDVYKAICEGHSHLLAFELSPRFAPNGEIFDSETFLRLLDIPQIRGMKHSSLDRVLELERLAVRDARRPDFRIYTGNDLGIDMIEYGSDYLLGLATFAPEKFAERDGLWESADPAYYALSDSLQYLGNVAFRDPIPAYKHSAAIFLHETGRAPTDLTHPASPRRQESDGEILRDCALRLGLSVRDT